MDTNQYFLWRLGTDTQVQRKFTVILGCGRKEKSKRGQECDLRRKTSLLIICEIGTTLPTSTMGHGSPNFSMYETTSNKVRTQVGKTRQGVKHGHHRWKEEPIYWDSRKCGVKDPQYKSTNQHSHCRFHQGGIIARIKLVRKI